MIISAFCSFFYSSNIAVFSTLNEADVVSESTEKSDTPYQDKMDKCPYNASVGDRFVCIADYSERITAEADTLANKLITQAPLRIKEVITKKDGPMPWEYGGTDFLAYLPEMVEKSRKAKDQYIESVCMLASMKIFGSTGMDIEEEACRYYYTEQYVEILKGLEGSVK